MIPGMARLSLSPRQEVLRAEVLLFRKLVREL